MKKIFAIIAVALLPIAASAQFEQGKLYSGASLTSLNLSYSGDEDLAIGAQAQAGMFVFDNVLAYGQLGWNHQGDSFKNDRLELGVGGRYYILQNGIFLGAGAKLADMTNDLDFQPNLSLGYAFFLNRTVTIEPELYFNLSTKDIDNSSYGFRLGFGIYLFNE